MACNRIVYNLRIILQTLQRQMAEALQVFVYNKVSLVIVWVKLNED